MKSTLTLNPPQIRKSFKSISFRAFYGTYFKAIKDKFKEQGLFKEMLVDAYGDRLPAEMLEELYDAGWLQLDHVVAATMDEPNNFFETCSVPDPEGAFNCPGASPSPLHAIDATLPQDSCRLTGRAPRSS